VIALREKLTKLFSVFSLLLLLSLVPVCQAKTIIVDGDPSDWAGISPLVQDKEEDAPPDEDLQDCFCTDDCTHLCFLVTFWGELPYFLVINIDSDQNPGTGLSDFGMGIDVIIILEDGPETGVYMWDGDPDFVKVADPTFAVLQNDESLFEICVLLEDAEISPGDTIDILFEAGGETDYAPDEGHATYTLGVCEPSEPVGGEIFPIDKVTMFMPYFIVALVLLTATSILIKKRRN